MNREGILDALENVATFCSSELRPSNCQRVMDEEDGKMRCVKNVGFKLGRGSFYTSPVTNSSRISTLSASDQKAHTTRAVCDQTAVCSFGENTRKPGYQAATATPPKSCRFLRKNLNFRLTKMQKSDHVIHIPNGV